MRWVILVEFVSLGVVANAALATTFTIDQSRTMLVVQLFRDGVAAKLGHDHVVTFGFDDNAISGAPGSGTTGGVRFVRELFAGKENPPHYHPNCEELIYVLSGQCDHQLGDAVHPLKAGDLLRIPTGVVHCARNTG